MMIIFIGSTILLVIVLLVAMLAWRWKARSRLPLTINYHTAMRAFSAHAYVQLA